MGFSRSLLALTFSTAVSAAAHRGQRRQDGPVPSGTITDCTYFVDAQAGDTCASIASDWGISNAQFLQYNPSVKSDCSGLVVGDSYCVEENYGNGPASTSTSTSTTPTTSATNAPSPVQTGIASNCQRYYQVQSGDTCAGIVDSFHEFTLSDFYSWNKGVGDQCQSLLSGYYVCVGVPGTPTTPITTPSPKATGVSPTQSGIASNCVKYYQAVSGDSCDAIANSFGTFDTATFISWNPAVGSNCQSLFSGYYYCVAVPGTPTSRTSALTTASPTPTGPSPTQTGIVSDCTKYYQAVSGDSCSGIVDKFGTFTLDQFYSWNSAVGSNCANLYSGYYYCVAVPGTPTARTTASPSPTPNGPQPQQPGIVSNCNNFYKVSSGDGCYSIEQAYSISSSQFLSWNTGIKSDCSNLYLGYYVCVGVS